MISLYGHHFNFFHLILGLFIVLSVIYSLYTPALEESDGWFHWWYARTLMEGGDDVEYYTHRSPPLYYLIQASFLSLVDPSELEDHSYTQTKRNFFEDFNYFRHISRDDFPYGEENWNRGCVGMCTGLPEKFPFHGISLAVHYLRFFSIFCGIISLYFLYKIVQAIFPSHRSLQLYSVAFASLIPQFIFINSVLASESLAISFSSAAIYFLVKFSTNTSDWRSFFVMSICTGLALITKITPFFLILVILAFLLYLKIYSKISLKSFFIFVVSFVVIMIISGGWWWMFTSNNFFEWILKDVTPIQSSDSKTIDTVTSTLRDLSRHNFVYFDSVWGTIGWKGLKTAPELVSIVKIFYLISGIGLIIYFRKRIKDKIISQKHFVIILFVSLLMFIIQVLYELNSGSGTGRNMLPATVGFAPLVMLGAYSIFSRNKMHYLLILPLGIFLLINFAMFVQMNEYFDHGLPRDEIYDENKSLRMEMWLGHGSAETDSLPSTRIRNGYMENGYYDNFLLIHPPKNGPKWWNFTTTIPNNEYDLEASYGFLTNARGRTDPIKFEIFIDDQKVLDKEKHFTTQVDKQIIPLHKNVGQKIQVALAVDATEYGNYKAWSFFKLKYVK